MKILFVLDKWCEGKPKFGISEWETNLWQSLKATNLAQVDTFHYDDYVFRYGQGADGALLKQCQKFKPNAICLVLYRLPGSHDNVAQWQTLEVLKHQLKLPIFSIWGDLESPEQVKLSQKLTEVMDFYIYTATSVALHGIKTNKPYIYFWVPKDQTVFFNPKIKRDIDISFVGSLKPERVKIINYLKAKGIKVMAGGGERASHLTAKQYAKILHRSKISLNFSRSGWLPVITARSFEITGCGAMLLEEAGPETAKLFIPGVDYVPFFSKKDLLEKIRYYLVHDREREAVARNGWQTCSHDYSAKRFWQLVLAMIKGEKKPQTIINFRKLSDWRLKVMDRFYADKYFTLICYYGDRLKTKIF